MASRKRTCGPVFARKATRYVRVPVAPRYEKRCLRVPFPEAGDQMHGFGAARRDDRFHWVSREQESGDDVEEVVTPNLVPSTENLQDRPSGAVAPDDELAVCATLQENGGALCGLPSELSDGLRQKEGPDFLGGRPHWLVRFDDVPHLLLQNLAAVLDEHAERGGTAPPPDGRMAAIFLGQCVAKITILAYLERMARRARLGASTFVVAAVYLDRGLRAGSLVLCPRALHRVVLGALVLAAKFVDDDVLSDRDLAEVGGVSRTDFGRIERAFLVQVLEWRLYVCEVELLCAADKLRGDKAEQPGVAVAPPPPGVLRAAR